MIKQTVTFEDYSEPPKEVTEDFYFNINKLEILELELKWREFGGLDGIMKMIGETEDAERAYFLFKEVLLSSHGVRTPDGRGFKKSPEIMADFEASPALSEIIIGFLQNPEEAAAFFEKVLPQKLLNEARAAEAKTETPPVLDASAPVLEEKTKKNAEDYTRDELLAMTQDEFDKVAGTDPVKMTPALLQVAYQRKNQL